jgi:hypothetical protein
MKHLNKLTMRHMVGMAAGTGALLLLSPVIVACGASSGTGSITPSGTTHGTFRYCSYTPDSDGIEISHHEATPCVVGDARSKKDRKKKAKHPVVVPVPRTSATGRSSNGSLPTAKATTKTPSTKASTKAPKLSLTKPKPKPSTKS